MIHTTRERIVYSADKIVLADLMAPKGCVEVFRWLFEGSQLITEVDSFGIHDYVEQSNSGACVIGSLYGISILYILVQW